MREGKSERGSKMDKEQESRAGACQVCYMQEGHSWQSIMDPRIWLLHAGTPGAREQTAAEYGALFQTAGFELTRVVPTPAGPSEVEAVPI